MFVPMLRAKNPLADTLFTHVLGPPEPDREFCGRADALLGHGSGTAQARGGIHTPHPPHAAARVPLARGP